MYVTRFFIFHFFIFRAQLWFFFSRNRGLHFLLLLYVKKEKKKKKKNVEVSDAHISLFRGGEIG